MFTVFPPPPNSPVLASALKAFHQRSCARQALFRDPHVAHVAVAAPSTKRLNNRRRRPEPRRLRGRPDPQAVSPEPL